MDLPRPRAYIQGMGIAMNQRGVAHAHHHHQGVEYIVAGIGIMLLFGAFAVLQSVLSGQPFNPLYIGVFFGLVGVAMGTTYWARH